jgi:hypothetical protein
VFSATTDTFLGRVYSFFLEVLNNKADGILHGNCLQCWVHLFPEVSEVIKNKLNRPQYGELLFESVRIIGLLACKIDEIWVPITSPTSNEELAERQPDAEYLQWALYSGPYSHELFIRIMHSAVIFHPIWYVRNHNTKWSGVRQ